MNLKGMNDIDFRAIAVAVGLKYLYREILNPVPSTPDGTTF